MKLRKNKYKNVVKEANKFKPFDYGFLLELEETSLTYMRDYFNKSKIAVGNERNAELISLAIKLLRIATDKDSALEFSWDDSREYRITVYVNTRNASRFNHNFTDYGPFELESLRIEKAWRLYHRIREQYMREWWD